MKRWLQPPRFPGDEEKTRRAAVVNSLGVLHGAGLLSAAAVLVPFFATRKLAISGILLVLAGLLAVSRVAQRRGRLDLAAALVLAPAWASFFCVALFSGGIMSPVMVAVGSVTVVATLVFREPTSRFLLLSVIVGGLALALLPVLGIAPPTYFHVPPLAAWFIVSLSVFFMVRMAVLYARSLGVSEARFRAVVEHSHDGILFTDRQSNLIYRSPSYRRLNGYTDEERLGASGFETVHPDDLPMVKRAWEDLISRPDGSFRLEYRIRHKDGHWIWADTSAQNLLEDPEVHAVVVTTRDITARRQAEEARRESEAIFRALFEEANDSVFLLEQGADGGPVIADANAAACQAHGYSHDELVGLPISALNAPADRERVPARAARLTAEGRATFDSVHVRKDGTTFDMAVSVRRVERRGKPPLMFSIERDISDRVRTQAELRQSEERYRMLVEMSPDAVVVHRDGRIVFANAAAATLFGAASETDLVGMEIDRLVPHAGAPGVHPGVRLDGAAFELEAASATVSWYGVKSSLTVIRDVSDRRRSERLEARYTLLNENVRDPMMLVTLDGRIVEANPAAVSFYGYSLAELLALRIFDLRPSERREVITHQLEQARREGIFYESNHVRKDGTAVAVEVYARRVTVEEEDFLLSVIRDVSVRKAAETKLRESEERWRSIVNASPDAILVASLEGIIQQASRRVFHLWGFDPDREVIGQSMFGLLAPEDRERARATFQGVLLGRAEAPAQYAALRRDGKRRTIEVNREVLRNARGLPTGLVLVIRDVTDRVALEAQLRQAQKMESVGRLAGGVAHDFNNLLQVILGNAQEAIETLPGGAAQRDQIQEIIHAGARSADLTRQLLAFARRQEVVPRVLDLNETVSRALKMLRRLIGEDIELVWKPGPSLWKVKIDPAQVDQVLANLASNARDALEGVGTLAVSTSNALLDEAWCASREGAAPGEYVRLSVSDTGNGMSPEVIAHLFEPFFTTKGMGQGTGLGLATVYGIVKQGHGFVDVDSVVGAGTTVHVYLPRTLDPATPDGELPGKARSGRNETVLVVEDEASILLLLQRTLQRLGYSVLVAHSPAEALRLIGQYPATLQLLLSDVVMPGMDGKQLYERVKALRPGVRALFMSGYTAEVISQRGVIEEGTPFIQKPFTSAALAAKVREVMEGQDSRRDGS